MSFTGHCHCRAVTLTVPHRPEYMNDCNCTLCLTRGGTWGYFRPGEVTVAGATTAYVRADTDNPYIATHFCPVCGTTTHWWPLGDDRYDRMGVNMRLFPADARDGVEIRKHDGINAPL
jgi:hypothetical protein